MLSSRLACSAGASVPRTGAPIPPLPPERVEQDPQRCRDPDEFHGVGRASGCPEVLGELSGLSGAVSVAEGGALVPSAWDGDQARAPQILRCETHVHTPAIEVVHALRPEMHS